MSTGPSYSIPAPVAPLEEVKRKPRTLVLCFDGTADEYSTNVTNVVKLYSLLRKDKVEDQLCYYQAGIGTYFAPGIVKPLFQRFATLMDEAVAWYLYQHVLDGYKFLMQNYNVGDKVCLFGFSRGAYTARALAGMLHKVGLLSKDNSEQLFFAYKLYKSTSSSDKTLAHGFKETFCRPVPIDFVGVWDTVASVGVVMGRSLPFVNVNTTIRVFRQALSLDEHRAKFRPNLYHRGVPDKSSKLPGGKDEALIGDQIYQTDMTEVWFAGCHSDVGGGNAPNNAQHALADLPLRWMVEQIVRAETQILWDYDAFARWNIPTTIGQNKPLPPSQGGATEDATEQDVQDALQPITDQLFKNPLWWILEIIPTGYKYQNPQGKWITIWWPHFGRGRRLPPDPLFHTSVKIREDDAKLKYKPRARYQKGSETYVS
ncbi:hypothetical protein DFH94DRAFT_691438 [Russula ochroleuca]|jgi:hypothetical protein|uniref:T6SS Phospholipase effector Tle1-like catalytic domain-containing protein n=1 Tax=Russula ochroleuca TaxID=152965 RepID=A0A9P5MY96_9AGAM|nr:hypothetical protein DFH94DRAFT_691438 [Russula ochroleuca]